MEPGRGRGLAEAGGEARAQKLVAHQQVNPGPLWQILQAPMVQPAVTPGRAPGFHARGGRNHNPGSRSLR